MSPEHEIGNPVHYWCAKNPKDNVSGVVVDIAFGEDLCECNGEDDDCCEDVFVHNNWYVKVKTKEGVTDWLDEYYWRVKSK